MFGEICGKVDLRLVILAVIHSAFENLVTLMGIQCSSWVQVNSGTSQRDILNPMGRVGIPSVDAANLMTSRQGNCFHDSR